MLELEQARAKIHSLKTEHRDTMIDLTSIKALLVKEKEKLGSRTANGI